MKRHFLRFAFRVCLLVWPHVLVSAGTTAKKPNILFILIEDQGAHLGCRGTPGLKTPNLDRLAAEGTLFREAFVGYPVCSPSKACIYTGLYPHENGLRNNTQNYPKPAAELKETERNNPIYKNVRLREACVTWVEVLKRQGYFLGQSGKLHVAPVDKFPYDVYLARGDGGKKEVSPPPGGAGNKLRGNCFATDPLHWWHAHGSYGPPNIGATVPLG